MHGMLLRRKTLCSRPKALLPDCLGLQDLKTLSFIRLPVWSLEYRGSHAHSRFQPALWVSPVHLTGVRPEQWPLFVLYPPTPVDSTLRLEKTENISAHLLLFGQVAELLPASEASAMNKRVQLGDPLQVRTTDPVFWGSTKSHPPLPVSDNALQSCQTKWPSFGY